MRPGLAVVLVLVSVSLPGCWTPDADRSDTLVGTRRLFSGPTGDDVVYLSVALVERPVGDKSLNFDLWEMVNEQVVDSDQRTQLARNGFRIGRVGGLPPPALHSMICSERSCSDNARRIQLRADHPSPVKLGPTLAQCRFQLDRDGRQTTVELTQALCQFQIVPKLTDGGRVTLQFTPFIKHGEMKHKPIAVHTPGGELQWDLQVAQDEETYEWLAWELTLDADDTVVIGTGPDTADTLGRCCFVQPGTPIPMQRLLVLRAGRLLADPAEKKAAEGDGLPLAIQAGLSE